MNRHLSSPKIHTTWISGKPEARSPAAKLSGNAGMQKLGMLLSPGFDK